MRALLCDCVMTPTASRTKECYIFTLKVTRLSVSRKPYLVRETVFPDINYNILVARYLQLVRENKKQSTMSTDMFVLPRS